ncbi:MAG: hypothetical protein H0V19_00885 [Euzebyales bacterium]|nr:hypothetical protein [Euzebyales bacterium]
MNEQPAALVGMITAAVAALIALFVAFGVDLNPDQQAAILSAAAVAAPLVAALIIKRQVWSPASHEAAIQQVRRVEAAATHYDHVHVAPAADVDRPPMG